MDVFTWSVPFLAEKVLGMLYTIVKKGCDEAFEVMVSRHQSRVYGLALRLTKSSEDACMVEFRDHLEKALDDLQVLFDDDCTHKAAMAAWKKVFNDKFFDEQTASENQAAAGFAVASSVPSAPVHKQGGGRFG